MTTLVDGFGTAVSRKTVNNQARANHLWSAITQSKRVTPRKHVWHHKRSERPPPNRFAVAYRPGRVDGPRLSIAARTTPTIWDVHIARFGGLAGIAAPTRRKNNCESPELQLPRRRWRPILPSPNECGRRCRYRKRSCNGNRAQKRQATPAARCITRCAPGHCSRARTFSTHGLNRFAHAKC